MLSIIIATIGYILLGIVFILDKFILTGSTVKEPEVYTFYSTFFMIGALVLLPFTTTQLVGIDWFWASVSGIAFGFALWTMFIALKAGETSHMSPFIGAATSIVIFIIAFIFLQETLTSIQIVGVLIMVFATFLLSFETTKKNRGFHIGFLWGLTSGIFYAISHVSAKYIYDSYPFLTGFIWTRATTAFVAILVLTTPAVWKHFKYHTKKKITQSTKFGKKKISARKTFTIITVDKIMAIIAVVFIQYAIAIGSVTIVGALAGLQYVFMFLLILGLTYFAPKLFKEYFTKREIIIQSLALLLVVVGYIFFII